MSKYYWIYQPKINVTFKSLNYVSESKISYKGFEHTPTTLDCWSPTCSLWHFSRLRRSPSQLGGFLRLAFGATNLMRIKWAQSIRSENTHILHSTNVKTNFFFKKKWANPGFFFVYFRSFSNKHYYNFLQQINVKNVMSIQYTALGFEPTTFGSWASSHNH